MGRRNIAAIDIRDAIKEAVLRSEPSSRQYELTIGTIVQNAEFRNMLVKNTQINDGFHTLSVFPAELILIVSGICFFLYFDIDEYMVLPKGIKVNNLTSLLFDNYLIAK